MEKKAATRKEMINRIVDFLTEGNDILQLYRKHKNGNAPVSGLDFKLFIFDVMEYYKTKDKLTNPKSNITFLIDWLLGQKDNTLPYPSSGSLEVALEDVDNFTSGIEFDREMDEEEFMFFNKLYGALFR